MSKPIPEAGGPGLIDVAGDAFFAISDRLAAVKDTSLVVLTVGRLARLHEHNEQFRNGNPIVVSEPLDDHAGLKTTFSIPLHTGYYGDGLQETWTVQATHLTAIPRLKAVRSTEILDYFGYGIDAGPRGNTLTAGQVFRAVQRGTRLRRVRTITSPAS